MLTNIKNQHLLLVTAGLAVLSAVVCVFLLLGQWSAAAERQRATEEVLRNQREVRAQLEGRLDSAVNRIVDLEKSLADVRTQNAAAQASLRESLAPLTAKKWLMALPNTADLPWSKETKDLRGSVETLTKAVVSLTEWAKKLDQPDKK